VRLPRRPSGLGGESELEAAPEALDHDDRPGLAVPDPVGARDARVGTRGVREHPRRPAPPAQRVIPSQAVAQAIRQRQHPLAHLAGSGLRRGGVCRNHAARWNAKRMSPRALGSTEHRTPVGWIVRMSSRAWAKGSQRSRTTLGSYGAHNHAIHGKREGLQPRPGDHRGVGHDRSCDFTSPTRGSS
jgi:hypothetical protein